MPGVSARQDSSNQYVPPRANEYLEMMGKVPKTK